MFMFIILLFTPFNDFDTFETSVVTEPVVDSEVPLPNPTTEHDPVPDIVEVHGTGNATNAPVAVPDDEAAPFPELHDDPAYNPRPAPAFPPGQSATLHDLQFVTCPGPAQCDKPPCCLLYTSPSPRDATLSRMPSSA